jgi:hypothetical protein
MATQAITEVSSVAHIDGVAKVRLPDGSLKELKVGDTLQPGMVVILDDGPAGQRHECDHAGRYSGRRHLAGDRCRQ